MKSLCKTCSERCSEFYEKDTLVYECDDYKKEVKSANKRFSKRKSQNS